MSFLPVFSQSPQGGWIIPEDESSKYTKVDGYKLKSTDWTDHPRRMKILNPQKWTDIN